MRKMSFLSRYHKLSWLSRYRIMAYLLDKWKPLKLLSIHNLVFYFDNQVPHISLIDV